MVDFVFFFNDTATTEIYTLPYTTLFRSRRINSCLTLAVMHDGQSITTIEGLAGRDRKSTRLNSSHANISYAVFCLKKKMIDIIVVLLMFFSSIRPSQQLHDNNAVVTPLA